MSEETEDYLEIASNCIKWAEIQGTMKNYVAGLLKDNDKKDKLLEQKENIIKELNNIINVFMEELKWQRKSSLSLNEAFAVSRIDTLINKLQELKGSEK